MSVPTLERVAARGPCLSDHLLVAMQDGASRGWHAVGFLSKHDDGWSFDYLARAVNQAWFSPLFGFPQVGHSYRSEHLFPFFSQRLMSARRPDRPAYLEALALGPDASSFDVLARSGGRRAGDNVELLPVPSVTASGDTCSFFLVHGIRYAQGAGDAISRLRSHDPLILRDEPSNPVDPRAMIVSSVTGDSLGWVPAPLLHYVRDVRESGEHALTVVRASGPEVGKDLRLLVCLAGRYRKSQPPFTGPEWATAATPSW